MHICVFREQEKFRSIVHKLCIVTITRHKGDLSIYLRIGAFLFAPNSTSPISSENEFSKKLYQVYELFINKDDEMLNNAIKGIDQYSIETFYNKIIKAYKHVLKSRW